MSSQSTSRVDRLLDFSESALGIFSLGCLAAVCFLFYASQNAVGTIAPGMYYFGVIVPSSLFFLSVIKQSKTNFRVGKAVVGIAFVVWAISNAVLRHS